MQNRDVLWFLHKDALWLFRGSQAAGFVKDTKKKHIRHNPFVRFKSADTVSVDKHLRQLNAIYLTKLSWYFPTIQSLSPHSTVNGAKINELKRTEHICQHNYVVKQLPLWHRGHHLWFSRLSKFPHWDL